ncbi:hypothetical protein [Rhodococcus sp. NPDC058639]|uniref:hypothetical protein n=1 Tax=Rhodococcus sp. NPDC058639 TaxID=3346570 RepID=UPI00364999E5
MSDDAPASAGDGLPSGTPGDATARSGGPKRSGTFVYPLPSTPLPSSTPLTGTVRPDSAGKSAPGASGANTESERAIDRDPAGGVDAGIFDEGTTLVSSTSTNGTVNGAGTATDGARTTTATSSVTAPTPSRRNSMGVASVRIAARLAQNELGTSGGQGDPISDNDELLTLLGEYLVAGGLEKPELHVTLGGQTIVVDLQTPQRHAR